MTAAVHVRRAGVTAGRVRSDAVLAGGSLAACVALALSPGSIADGPVLCPFRIATGLPCPACGSIRAWVHLGEGDLAAALDANPFAVGLFAAFVVLLAWRLAALVLPATRRPDVGALLAAPATLLLVSVWAAWGVLRAGGVT